MIIADPGPSPFMPSRLPIPLQFRSAQPPEIQHDTANADGRVKCIRIRKFIFTWELSPPRSGLIGSWELDFVDRSWERHVEQSHGRLLDGLEWCFRVATRSAISRDREWSSSLSCIIIKRGWLVDETKTSCLERKQFILTWNLLTY